MNCRHAKEKKQESHSCVTFSLVNRARSGDFAAFESLLQASRAPLSLLIRRTVPSRFRKKVQLEDILHETYLSAHQRIKDFKWRGEKSFHKWIGEIADRVLAEFKDRAWGSEKRNRTPSPCCYPPGTIVDPIGVVERLMQALEALSEDQYQVVYLTHFQKLRLSEVANLMKRSPHAVSRLLARSLRELKQKLVGSGEP